MLTGTHFNRSEGIIGSQYLDLYPVHVRMPTRIVTVEKNHVAFGEPDSTSQCTR